MLVGLVALLLLLGGGWLWLRDSSLVAVNRVSISGASGPDAARIRAALGAAARNMTTLDIHMDQLRNAVAPYPVVRDLQVTTHFPHAITIRVIEHDPVGAVVAGGRQIAVAGDGTLLHDVAALGSLPQIPLRVAPGGRRLTDHDALSAVALLRAAPYQWLGRISQVSMVSSHGLVAQIRGGPSVYFGDDARLGAKWAAAAAVLADPGTAGALYIDVTYPERPAAGAGSAGSTGSSSAGGGGSTGATGPATGAGTPGGGGSTGMTGPATGAGTAPTSTTPTGG
jgi:cell division protein FtsQ